MLTSGSNGLSGSCDIPHTANIDKYMKPRDMTADAQESALHYFNMYVVTNNLEGWICSQHASVGSLTAKKAYHLWIRRRAA